MLAVGLLGLGCSALLFLLDAAGKLPLSPGTSEYPPLWLFLAFVAMTFLSQVVFVRVRRGEVTEELAFFEAVASAGMLLIAPVPQFVAMMLGLLAHELVSRRPKIKLLYNLGDFAASTSAMIITYRIAAGGAPPLQGRSVVAVFVAMLVFTAINLALLAELLHRTSAAHRWSVVREQWRLSAFMAYGGMGVGVVAVALLKTGPWLVPMAAIPAVALWFAYGATAAHAQARVSNYWLVVLGGQIAKYGRGDSVLAEATEAIRRVVRAPEMLVVRSTPDQADPLLDSLIAAPGPRPLTRNELPRGWREGVVTRLDLGASSSAALLLGSKVAFRAGPLAGRSRGWRLAESDTPVLGALAAAVGSSISVGRAYEALAEETAKLSAVVDNTSDGIAVVDDGGRVRLWSRTMARMTGVSWQELQDAPPEHQPEIVKSLLSARKPKNHVETAFERLKLRRSDGETLDVVVSSVRVAEASTEAASGSGSVNILTVHDETRERRVERMKTDFVATISHELRTPITPIKGYAHLLATRGDRIPAEKRRAALQMISDRADHLTRLVDDLLLASQVSDDARLAVEMGVVDVADVIGTAVDTFPDLAGRLRVSLPADPVCVQCDRMRAVQCLSNLIGNAEKYTPANTPIEIWVQQGPKLAGINVRDHGPGIAPSERERVFQRFYRIEESLTSSTGGAGLGLHIARELALAMGGGLDLRTPQDGQGAQFVLYLPTVGDPEPDARTPQDNQPPLTLAPRVNAGQSQAGDAIEAPSEGIGLTPGN